MAQRSHVPKFGNWESEENVPYTAYFDKARKGKTTRGKMINPNDPQENSETFLENSSPPRAPPAKTRVDQDEPVGCFSDSPAHKASTESTNQRYGGGRGSGSAEMHKRQGKPSGGSEHSVERSPLHPQARSSEGKVLSEGSHGTPGRSRMKPVIRADDSPDRGAAVPRFGEWDETNPSSADGYTHIFNKVREEKLTGAAKAPGMTPDGSYSGTRKQKNSAKSKICCFPWGRQ